MSTPSFSTTEAAQLAGVTYRQADHWARMGLVGPSLTDPSPGYGARRRYTLEDVVVLRVVAELLTAGLSLRAPAQREVIGAVVGALRRQEAPGACRLLIAGKLTVTLDSDQDLLTALTQADDIVVEVLIVDAGRAAEQVRAAAATR